MRALSLPKLVVEYKVTSKANRMWHFFKPKEIVEGENFDVEFRFINNYEDFQGGSFDLIFRYPENVEQPEGKVEIPEIKKGESKIKKLEDKIMITSGYCGFIFRNQITTVNNQEQVYYFLYTVGGERLEKDSWLGIDVSSKDELYQKYSVTVALWTSVISILISTIGILIQLLVPQNIQVVLPENFTIAGMISILIKMVNSLQG